MSKIFGIPVATPMRPGGTGGGATDEQIANAVSNYMAENPIDVGVKTVNGNQPDENGNVNIAGSGGYTPVKGVDYFTPEEVQEIAEQAAELVDVPSGETGGVSSWNDLTDKPFGEDGEATTNDLIDLASTNQKNNLNGDYSVNYFMLSGTLQNSILEVGKEYTVNINGHVYTDTARDYSELMGGAGAVGIGQVEDFVADEYEKVTYTVLAAPQGDGYLFSAVYRSAEAELIEFTVSTQGIKTLDEKYIPHTIARTADVQTMIDTALGVIENGTY